MPMTYNLVIEGEDGARKVRHGALPRKGEWVNLRLDRAWWWLPVLEVAYSLSQEKRLEPAEEGCDFAHDNAESLVFTSLAVAVPVKTRSPDELVKLVLPPSRWPLGGRVEDDQTLNDGGPPNGRTPGAFL